MVRASQVRHGARSVCSQCLDGMRPPLAAATFHQGSFPTNPAVKTTHKTLALKKQTVVSAAVDFSIRYLSNELTQRSTSFQDIRSAT